MSKGGVPQAPDPVATANAQTQSNIATATNNAALNRVDQYTPLGSSTYNITGTSAGGTPQYSQTVSLSPEQQQLYDNYTKGQQGQGDIALGMQNQVANSYASPINTSGVPGVQSGVQNSGPGITGNINYNQPIQNSVGGDYSAASKQAQDAAYDQQKLYLDPQYAQQQSTTDAKLANMGLSVGDRGYQAGQDQLAQSRERAYQSARDDAIGIGNQRQSDLFGQSVTAGNFANNAQQQGYNQAAGNATFQNAANQQGFNQGLSGANLNNSASAQAMQQLFALRNQPLNEYNSLMTGAQVSQPTFGNVPGASQANTDVAGITNSGYQNQLAGYNASQQGINNLFSLGGSLGGAAILASDRRLKRDIVRVGTTHGGIPTYTFRYNDGAALFYGVMADEVMHIPGAAVLMDNGFYGVNYSVVQ